MKKLILILLTAAMLCALLCGCPKEGPVTPETTGAKPTESTAALETTGPVETTVPVETTAPTETTAPSGEGLGENDLPIY